MFQPSGVRECQRCGRKIYDIAHGFQKCGCGVSTKIIGLAANSETCNPLNTQFRISYYLKLACSKKASDKLSRIASSLSLNVSYKVFGRGNLQEAQNALNADVITCEGAHLLIPNLIDGEIVSGIWQVTGSQLSYLEILPGGLAFSFTLTEPARFVNQIFVFQNLQKALSLLLEIYSRYGIFVPIVAHPDLRILENIEWLPKKEIVLVVDELRPQELRSLLPLNPRVIQADTSVQYEGSPYKLHFYYNKAEFLEDLITECFALNPRYGVIVANNKWYYTPSGSIALNADIHIEKIKVCNKKRIYQGCIQFASKRVDFTISEKGAYKKLKRIALKHGMNLYCAPRLADHILELAAVKSRPEAEEIIRFGIQRNHTILLPNLIITEKQIIPEVSAVGKNVIAKNLHWVPEPFLHLCRYYKEDRGTVSQLTAITALLLLLGYSLVHRQENAALFLITDTLDSAMYIMNCCGVGLATEAFQKHLWPSIYPNPEHLLTGPKKPLPVTYGDYKYLALVMLHYKTLVANISSIFIPLIPEDTIQHYFVFNLRKILEVTKSTRWLVKRDVNKELFRVIQKKINPNTAIVRQIAKRIRFQFYSRKRKALALLVGRLIDEQYLNKSFLKAVNTEDYEIDVQTLNTILEQLGLPPVIPIIDDNSKELISKSDLNRAINNPQGLIASLEDRRG